MLRKSLLFAGVLALLAAVLALFHPATSSNAGDAQLAQAQKKKQQGKAQQASAPKQLGSSSAEIPYLAVMRDEATRGGAAILSEGDSYDDFTSIAQASDGTLYAAYASYYDGHDQIRLHRRNDNGHWSTRTYVPVVQAQADIWMPQLAIDDQDRVWVIWAEQTGQGKGQTGNWDLYARPFDGSRWGSISRLTRDPKPDINHHVFVDAKRNIHVVWQAHPKNNGDVQYCQFDGKEWSQPLAVTSDAASDWYPRGAVDSRGHVWIAFDTYRNGDYDVVLAEVADGKVGELIPIAVSNYYEAHASVACTRDGRVWVAWEQGGHNWGKDQGYWLRTNQRDRGSSLGSTRSVKVACWQDGKLLAAPNVADSLPQDERRNSSGSAELAAGADGRLWLRYRHLQLSEPQGQRRRRTRAWMEYVTALTPEGWARAQQLPASAGRISVFSRILPVPDGSLWVGYSGDARGPDNYHRPIRDTALVTQVAQPSAPVGTPTLAAYTRPDPPDGFAPWETEREAQQVEAIRTYRATINGAEHRIVRGDLHRHTELSWDVGPGNDGSYLDFYRYMIDVAAMDFGGLTDHQGGGHYAYWWWLSEKSADMYYLAPRFVPLYSYERSVTFPNGHRNVFHAYRGVPVFPFQINLNQRGVFPGIGSGAVLENDTKLLYEYLHGSGGLCISHTSGTSSMGTDWRDNDPVIEPVVEIYQGARNSYEALGAPRVHPDDKPPQQAPGGFQKEGLIWNAYEKGYRLGTIAASDHGSTHISYAVVYTPENDRQAILDSIRKRQTYGATDNLIVEFWANGHFMGSEFTTADKPSLHLKVTSTSKIAEVKLVRNNEYIYTAEPKQAQLEVKHVDMQPKPGMNLYYFRLLTDTDEVAWCSPVWVNYQRK